MAGDTPATPVEVSRQLTALTGELRTLVDQLGMADRDASEKRHAADLAESRAFLNAEGSMDLRRHKARIDAGDAELAALVAESLVRLLRAKIRSVDTRIEVGRTYASTVRSEFKTLSYTPDP